VKTEGEGIEKKKARGRAQENQGARGKTGTQMRGEEEIEGKRRDDVPELLG